MMVEGYLNFKEEIGSSFFGYEISSLLDNFFFVRWPTASCALALACQPSVLINKYIN
jgi:hypothetical protein